MDEKKPCDDVASPGAMTPVDDGEGVPVVMLAAPSPNQKQIINLNTSDFFAADTVRFVR